MEKSLSDQKIYLRNIHLQARKAIALEDRKHWDNMILENVLAISEVQQAEKIFLYVARSGEVATKGLVQYLLQQGKQVLSSSPDIRAMPHNGLFKISFSPGLVSPMTPQRCHETRADQLDLIFVPGIVWDSDGYRIGFGGGYFDRLLEMARPDCLRIGLAYDSQLEREVPREPWDQPVDVLVTQSSVYRNVPRSD